MNERGSRSTAVTEKKGQGRCYAVGANNRGTRWSFCYYAIKEQAHERRTSAARRKWVDDYCAAAAERDTRNRRAAGASA